MQRGEILLAPFPYSNLRGSKRRPVCIVSDDEYNKGPDVVAAMVTSNKSRVITPGLGDVVIRDWKVAGLLHPSVLRAGRLFALETRLLGTSLGVLPEHDLEAADLALKVVLGLG